MKTYRDVHATNSRPLAYTIHILLRDTITRSRIYIHMLSAMRKAVIVTRIGWNLHYDYYMAIVVVIRQRLIFMAIFMIGGMKRGDYKMGCENVTCYAENSYLLPFFSAFLPAWCSVFVLLLHFRILVGWVTEKPCITIPRKTVFA